MVFVGVRQHDAQDAVGVFFDELGVGQDDLDAGRGLVAERHAQVDDDPLAVVRRAEAVQVEVHPDLVRPAQRQEHELVVFAGLGHSVLHRIAAVDLEHAPDRQVRVEVIDGGCRPME